MRESFVIHSEYIEDLPEELKGVFLRYVYEYGISGIEPALAGLEKTVWVKIKRRIDDDVLAFERKVSNLKQNKNRTTSEQKTATPTDSRTDTERTPNGHRTDTEEKSEKEVEARTGSVSVNEFVSVNESVNECVSVAEQQPAKPVPETAQKLKRFVKPKLEELREFCEEKKLNIDVDRFFNYYESKGWKVGMTPMKDWKAAVRNWAKNDNLYRPATPRISSDTASQVLQNYTANYTAPETDIEANLAEIQGVTNAELEENDIIF